MSAFQRLSVLAIAALLTLTVVGEASAQPYRYRHHYRHHYHHYYHR